MPTVYWTDPALNDLDGIFNFIAKDAPAYAQSLIQELMAATDRLEDFPLSGRTIPEADDQNLREVICQNYRIQYWIIDNERIDIIAVFHGVRNLFDPDNQAWNND